ncbi:MAG: 5'/3'-nucleotidase SurE [Bacteroidales bacterium]|nr:5'/3'-nucleotidase SurE [Bacteroidales bacterium]
MKQTREILVTNDDGYQARGIHVLAQMLRGYGNVTVVAPREPQSGKSVSLTLDKTLMIDLVEKKRASAERGSLRVYTLTGTPADCAKLGINLYLHEGRLPDLLVSGINHGSNASAASIYSGTLGATVEGTLYDIPSIGLSINTHAENPDFEGALFYGRQVIDWVLSDGMKRGIYLNVNIPAIPKEQIRGIRMARQGAGRWVKEFDHRVNQRGKHYFWMVGEFEDQEPVGAPDADHHLVDSGFVSVVPHRVDTTDYEELERLRDNWKLDR